MSLLTNEVEITVVLSDGLEPIVISFPATPVVVDPSLTSKAVDLVIVSNANTIPVAIKEVHFAHRSGSAPVLASITAQKTTIDPADTTIPVVLAFTPDPGEVTIKGGITIEFEKTTG